MLKWLFYFCIFTLSLGQLVSIFKGGDANLYIFDFVVAAFCAYGLFYFLAIKKKFVFPKYSIPFLFFILIALVSLVRVFPNYSNAEWLISGSYLLRWVVYFLSGVVVFNMKENKMMNKSEIIKTFVYSAVFVSIAGFIQLALLPDFEVLDKSLGWDPHKNRLASTFFDPNFVACYLVLIVALVLDNIEKVNKLALLLVVTAIFLTFSRSGWLMLGVVIFIYGIFKSRWLLPLSLFVVFLAYFAVPRVQTRIAGTTDPADSARYRIVSWQNTLQIAGDNLLFGTGFNSFRYVQKDYGFLDPDTFLEHGGAGSDSSLLFVLATTGVFGLTCYALGFLFPLIGSWSLVLGALLAGLFVESQFINSLFYPQIMFLLFSVLYLNHSFSRK
jgi:O-antigen ligase